MIDDPETGPTFFNDAQRRLLNALLDTILPASPDGRMPSAAEIDFDAYLTEQASEYGPALRDILVRLDSTFAQQALPRRVAAVQAFAADDAQMFDELLTRVYDCYYQDDRVRQLIGAEPGPPFPRGNVIPPGDLSSLSAVKQRSPGYRRWFPA